jgi:hypothetical protein
VKRHFCLSRVVKTQKNKKEDEELQIHPALTDPDLQTTAELFYITCALQL